MRDINITIKAINKILYVAIVAFVLTLIPNHGGIQSFEYGNYYINKEKYNIVQAEITDVKNFEIDYRTIVLFELKKEKVRYQVDNICFEGYMIGYPEKNKGDLIQVAVNKKNSKLKRCVPYNFSPDDKKLYEIAFEIVVGVLLLTVLLHIIAKLLQRVEKRKLEKDSQESYDYAYEKNKIIEKYHVDNYARQIDEDALIQQYHICINEDYMWCLMNLPDTILVDIGLLPIEGEKTIVSETLELRKKGLSLQYYVIGQDAELNYLCQCANSSQIYIFSSNLGITKTKYLNIYDYILAQIK